MKSSKLPFMVFVVVLLLVVPFTIMGINVLDSWEPDPAWELAVTFVGVVLILSWIIRLRWSLWQSSLRDWMAKFSVPSLSKVKPTVKVANPAPTISASE